jgi:hypothetical protein
VKTAASYVKFVEMAGARAVALVYNDDKVELLRRLKAVNLLLFPGGAASLELSSPFYQSAKWLFGMTNAENLPSFQRDEFRSDMDGNGKLSLCTPPWVHICYSMLQERQ